MNGENYQLCNIVTSVKNALYKKVKNYDDIKLGDSIGHDNIEFNKIDYEKNINFRFCYEHGSYKVESVEEWYKKCLSLNISDIKCLMSTSVNDRAMMGFANSNNGSIVCFFENPNHVTYFTPLWSFEQDGWNIEYQEYIWKDAPKGKPHFKDNTKELLYILKAIGQFSCEIGEVSWKGVFDKSIAILNGTYDILNEEKKLPILKLPSDKICLFEAASNADVFGAMGSWNDSPCCSAYEKGLEEEYNRLSDELLKQIRLAILYTVNEW